MEPGRSRGTKSLTLLIPQLGREGGPDPARLRDLEPTGPPDRTYKVVLPANRAKLEHPNTAIH